jgi:hypothetical protein
LRGLPPTEIFTDDFEIGHYREISTRWKGWKGRQMRPPLTDPRLTVDYGTLDLFRKIGWR